MIDRSTIEACRNGDGEARRRLYEHYAPLMLGVVRRYVANRQEAEDILHDGFVALFTKISDFRGEGSFEGWVRRIFVSHALNHLRQQIRHPLVDNDIGDLPPSALEGAPPEAVGRLSNEEILATLARLPEGYRTMINLHAIEGYDYEEIAQMLGIGVASCRSQYLRAKARLAALLNAKAGG